MTFDVLSPGCSPLPSFADATHCIARAGTVNRGSQPNKHFAGGICMIRVQMLFVNIRWLIFPILEQSTLGLGNKQGEKAWWVRAFRSILSSPSGCKSLGTFCIIVRMTFVHARKKKPASGQN
jgi:hypothetical protein